MQTPDNSLRARLAQARSRIDAADAEILLAHVLGQPRSWLIAHGEAVPSHGQAAAFDRLLERREAGEPVAYLTGTRGFWTLELAVTPATLVPRPETELLVEQALAKIPADVAWRLADLGTGSGAIALALARERPRAQVLATDLSEEALAVALGNAARNGIDNVEFRAGSWLAPLAGESFDLIASNPPYVADGDPHLARGSDGLNAIRGIVADAPPLLRAGGWLLLEHGLDQGAAVRALLVAAGFVEVETARDLEGRERVTLGQRP